MTLTPRQMQEARRIAESGNAKKEAHREAGYMKERRRIQAVNEEKTTRLRGLRLAKEAAEREAAENMAAEKAASPKKTRVAKTPPMLQQQAGDEPANQTAVPTQSELI